MDAPAILAVHYIKEYPDVRIGLLNRECSAQKDPAEHSIPFSLLHYRHGWPPNRPAQPLPKETTVVLECIRIVSV